MACGDFQGFSEVDHSRHEEARDRLLACARLEQAPEHAHARRLAPLTTWNERSAGAATDDIVGARKELSRSAPP
jgi:hypothetical protein